MHTMGQILSNWRAVVATFFAVTLIASAYVLGRGIEMPSLAEASMESELLAAVAAKDSDGDGLPDWEELLYGTDIHAVDTFHLGISDGEAVAKGLIIPKAVIENSTTATSEENTLTDAFAKAFFTLYLAAKETNGGADLSPEQTRALADEALQHFIENFEPASDYKATQDLKIEDDGNEKLSTFAALAEGVFTAYSPKSPIRELETIQSAIQDGDAEAIAALSALSRTYKQYAAGFAALFVPRSLLSADLALINAFAQRAAIYDGLARINTDPLSAILALQQLAKNEAAWMSAFGDMGTVYKARDISLPRGEPGAVFIRIVTGGPSFL